MPPLGPLQMLAFAVQTRPGQHASPRSPQTMQVPPRQVAPIIVQVLLAQHGWPAPPHAAHTPPTPHTDDIALQLTPPQQGWPMAPHIMQVPITQVPALLAHIALLAMQTLFWQQPPPMHAPL